MHWKGPKSWPKEMCDHATHPRTQSASSFIAPAPDREPQEAPEGPRKLQEAQEAPEGPTRLQSHQDDQGKPQEGPVRRWEDPGSFETWQIENFLGQGCL